MDIVRKVDPLKQSRVVVFPVISSNQDTSFEKRAFDQVANFFRKYGYLVPSRIEISNRLENQKIKKEDYEDAFQKVARTFGAKYVVLMKIKKIDHTKKINAAGVLVAGATVSGVGRYARAEIILKVYNPKTKAVVSSSAVEYKKDHIFGFWQSSKRMAKKVQKDVIHGMLSKFATKQIHRSSGYILEPIQTRYSDSKGFQ